MDTLNVTWDAPLSPSALTLGRMIKVSPSGSISTWREAMVAAFGGVARKQASKKEDEKTQSDEFHGVALQKFACVSCLRQSFFVVVLP